MPLGRDPAAIDPATSPVTTPTTPPKTATMTPSSRMAARICRLPMPTARSSPISRVRSNTDRAMVLEKPITAITSAMIRNTLITTSRLSTWVERLARYSAWSRTTTCGYSARPASSAARASSRLTPAAATAVTRLS